GAVRSMTSTVALRIASARALSTDMRAPVPVPAIGRTWLDKYGWPCRFITRHVPREECYICNMIKKASKKAVLNVTIDEHLAAEARLTAALTNTTISSVVEQALAEQLKWERIRRDGLKAIEEYYQEHGYPTEEEMAEAAAQVEEEHRLIDEARAAMEAARPGPARRPGAAPNTALWRRRTQGSP